MNCGRQKRYIEKGVYNKHTRANTRTQLKQIQWQIYMHKMLSTFIVAASVHTVYTYYIFLLVVCEKNYIG